MPAMNIVIKEVREASDETGRSYNLYRVDCYDRTSDILLVSTWKRYQAFVTLNQQLSSISAPLLQIPPKKHIRAVNVEERRVQLQHGLQAYVQSQKSLSQPFVEFCELGGKLDGEQCAPQVQVERPALTDAQTNVDQIVASQGQQNQLRRLVFGLLVVALSFRRSRKSFLRSLSTFLLGSCSGLSVCLIIFQKDALQRAAVFNVVKDELELPRSAGNASVLAQDETLASGGNSILEAAELLPDVLRQRADRQSDMFTKHLQDDVNAYGMPWELAKQSKGLEIYSSKAPGESLKVWKSRYTIATHANVEQIVEHLRIWEIRCAWDTTTAKSSKMLKTFADSEHDISIFSTHKVLTVSPREFVDLRAWDFSSGGTSLTCTFVSLLPDLKLPGLPDSSQGGVRGENKLGTGMRWELLPSDGPGEKVFGGQNLWKVEVVAHCDPKGWIPASVINSAMTMTLTDSCNCMVKHFGKGFSMGDEKLAQTFP